MHIIICYDRTSGDEYNIGQDVRAGVGQVIAGATARGWTVVARFTDTCPGDTPVLSRPGWKAAVTEGQRLGCPIAVREFSRFSTAWPALALLEFRAFTHAGGRLLSLAEPPFDTATTPDPDDGPDEGVELMRLITAWRWWSEQRATRRRVAAALADQFHTGLARAISQSLGLGMRIAK